MLIILRNLAFAIAMLSGVIELRGQGGPPMITDDPGTPGPNKWEINLAVAWANRPAETSLDLPAIDLNYGLGERIQLTLQTAPVLLKRRERGPIWGLGATEAALKWRFLDEQQNGISVSLFPRIIFNLLQSSVRHGLSEDGTRAQLPVQVAKTFGSVDLDFEWGALASTLGRRQWLYGIVGGIELSKVTKLMAELHGTSRTNFDQDVLTVNFGIRQVLTERCIFIGSLGREIRTPADNSPAFIGYIGVQLLY